MNDDVTERLLPLQSLILVSDRSSLYNLTSHTHNMLTVFIILIITLSCVGGVTVVTQNPPLISVNKGETVSLVCNTGSSTDGGRWYKQVAGGTPQFVLNSFHGWSSPKYGSGFSSPKFTVSYPTKSDCHLSISNVDVGDSAVYYCGTWDSSAKENVSQ
ncbi:immunoglobulin omega chain [Pimephales promelas]|nr:immunoglobulin omega chain [Pimephales promelas]